MLPPPMTPADGDLRDCRWMPLDVADLRDSDMGAGDAEAFRTAMLLWCAAWHQLPAASLPDDETVLARLAGFGRDLPGFHAAVAKGALHGWMKCQDGRLYHKLIAAKACEALAWRDAKKGRTEKARATKQARATETATEPATDDVTEDVTAPTVPDRTEPDLTIPLRRNGAPGAPAEAGLWRDGLAQLRDLTGLREEAARYFLGKLRKSARGDDAVVWRALRQCADLAPIDAKSWLQAAVKPPGRADRAAGQDARVLAYVAAAGDQRGESPHARQ